MLQSYDLQEPHTFLYATLANRKKMSFSHIAGGLHQRIATGIEELRGVKMFHLLLLPINLLNFKFSVFVENKYREFQDGAY